MLTKLAQGCGQRSFSLPVNGAALLSQLSLRDISHAGSGGSLTKKLSQHGTKFDKQIRNYVLSQLRRGHVTMWTRAANSVNLIETEQMLE